MTTHELEETRAQAAPVASATLTPAGEVRFAPGDEDACVYGRIEIAWYADRLEIRAPGAGRATVWERDPTGEDVVVEIAPPSLAELPEDVPGAD